MKMGDYRIGFMGFGHLAQVIFTALDRAKIVPRPHVLFRRRDAAKMKENEQKRSFEEYKTYMEGKLAAIEARTAATTPTPVDPEQ